MRVRIAKKCIINDFRIIIGADLRDITKYIILSDRFEELEPDDMNSEKLFKTVEYFLNILS